MTQIDRIQGVKNVFKESTGRPASEEQLLRALFLLTEGKTIVQTVSILLAEEKRDREEFKNAVVKALQDSGNFEVGQVLEGNSKDLYIGVKYLGVEHVLIIAAPTRRS